MYSQLTVVGEITDGPFFCKAPHDKELGKLRLQVARGCNRPLVVYLFCYDQWMVQMLRDTDARLGSMVFATGQLMSDTVGNPLIVNGDSGPYAHFNVGARVIRVMEAAGGGAAHREPQNGGAQ